MLYICDQYHNYWYEYIYHKYYKNSPHSSKHMFDIYSITHIFWGIIFIFISKRLSRTKNIFLPLIIFLFMTIFEVYENMPKQIIKYNRIEKDATGEIKYRGDSIINIIGDTICNIIGLYIGYQIDDIYNIFIILLLLFIIITKTVGFNYWISFSKFLFHT